MVDMPNPTSIPAVADWIELTLSIYSESISKASISAHIEGNSGEEPRESFISDVWQELSLRQQLYLRAPYIVQGLVVERNFDSSSNPAYLTCLILSLFGIQDQDPDAPKLFERLSCYAAKKYLNGEALNIGWPATGNVATTIEGKIKEIANRLNENYNESPDPRYNDRGVDVVGWIPFSDDRSGQIVFLLQCAAGQNWLDKSPVPLDAWYQYIHWAFNPIRAFSVPAVVSNRYWHEKTKDKGLLFDRIRIVNLFSERRADGELIDDLNAWVTLQLSGIIE
jgi:hypothetical protein